MFRLAVISDEISQDLAVAAAMVREFGGQGLEIRSVWEKSPPEFDADERRRIARIAAEYGLSICGVASPCYKCPLGEPAEEAQHLEMLRRCIALAHALDTNLIRVFTFLEATRPAAVGGHRRPVSSAHQASGAGRCDPGHREREEHDGRQRPQGGRVAYHRRSPPPAGHLGPR